MLSEALRVYRRNHKLRWGSINVRYFIKTLKKLDAHMIDHDLDEPLFLLKLLQKCIIRLLQVYCILQEMFPAVCMHRKPQLQHFPINLLFCGYYPIDTRCCNLEMNNCVSTLRSFSSSNMMRIPRGGYCGRGYCERMKHISSKRKHKL